jgi:single-stranded-DNA-specific exonuclease
MQSISGRAWQERDFNKNLFYQIKQNYHNISDNLAKLISSRVADISDVGNFIDPKIKNILPDPFLLLDMKLAVDSVIKAIEKKQKITIFADYDVDGGTSAAILKKFFSFLDYQVDIYIPDRILEGYGPNVEALLNLRKEGTDLLITVDCGTVAFEPLKEANKAGLEVIVIDHHLGAKEKPEAIAVINPNRFDENFPYKNICAATVCFLFIIALNKTLREKDFYQENSINEPNILSLIDLVALGTVCDVMPLTELNRAIVAAGLKIIKKRSNIGIRTLFDIANINEGINSYHLGFIIGPRINAGGRVGNANLGAKLLSCNDEIIAFEIANQLEHYNSARKEIENIVLNDAISKLEAGFDGYKTSDPVIFAVGKDWHQGVIGIVASRLKELYHKPVVVITIDSNTNKGKASCRSINDIDFGGQILQAKSVELIIEGGGHKMAGGFSIFSNKIADLHQFFCNNLATKIKEINDNKIHYFDLAINQIAINQDFIEELNILEPFGCANYRPKIRINNLTKIKSQLIGKDLNHISCIFANKTNIGTSNSISAVMFNINNGANLDIANFLLSNSCQNIDIIGSITINNYLGKEKPQIIIEDVLSSCK